MAKNKTEITLPTAPPAPKPRSLEDVNSLFKVNPYFVRGNPTAEEIETESIDFTCKGRYAVAIGPLSARDIAEYRIRFGEPIVRAVNRIIAVQEYEIGKMQKNLPDDYDSVIYDPITLSHDTKEWGPMIYELEVEMARLFAFIGSMRGKVTGYRIPTDDDKENPYFEPFEYEPVMFEDILTVTNPNQMVKTMVHDDGVTHSLVFDEFLRLAQLVSFGDYDQAAENAAKEDDPGKS